MNLDILKEYCKLIAEDIPTSSLRYYRGRIAKSPCGFTPSEMGAPPKDKSTEGRANSAGISRLYLTSNRETVFHEIRAAEYDYVTIGTFKQLVPLRVVNLSRIAKISPFAEDIDCTILAINKEHLSRINEELSRTMRRNDSLLDYLATQYISDFVMSIEDEKGNCLFDGVVYKSAMTNSGFNLAVFDPSKFKCTYCQTYEVSKLTYEKRISTI